MEAEIFNLLVSNGFAVEVVETSCHVASHHDQLVALLQGSCLPPLAHQERLEVALGTVLQQNQYGWSLHAHSKQR